MRHAGVRTNPALRKIRRRSRRNSARSARCSSQNWCHQVAGGLKNVMRTRRSRSSSDPVLSGPSFDKATEGKHRSVLLHEAVEALDISERDTVVDATLGGS